jgi:hypothetical protein
VPVVCDPTLLFRAEEWDDILPEEPVAEGGYIVCTGTPEEVAQCKESYTGKYLAKIIENHETK